MGADLTDEEQRKETRDSMWPSQRWAVDIAEPGTADMIWAEITGGKTLKKLCKEQGWPYSIVVKWKNETEDRRARYNTALADWADSLAQEAVGIADTPELGISTKTKADGSEEVTTEDMLGHRKLKVETRLKLASKLDRERYGDSMSLTGKGGGPVQFQDVPDDLEIARRLAYILTVSGAAIEKASETSRVVVKDKPNAQGNESRKDGSKIEASVSEQPESSVRNHE